MEKAISYSISVFGRLEALQDLVDDAPVVDADSTEKIVLDTSRIGCQKTTVDLLYYNMYENCRKSMT